MYSSKEMKSRKERQLCTCEFYTYSPMNSKRRLLSETIIVFVIYIYV